LVRIPRREKINRRVMSVNVEEDFFARKLSKSKKENTAIFMYPSVRECRGLISFAPPDRNH